MPHWTHYPVRRRALLGGAVGAATAAILAACGQNTVPTATAIAPAQPTGGALASPATVPTLASTAVAAVTMPSALATGTLGMVPASVAATTPASPIALPVSSPVAPSSAALRLARTAGQGSEIDMLDLTGKTITIDFWHTQTKANADILNKLCADFSAANPGITVAPQYVGSTNTLAKKLLVAIGAGQPPTVAAAIETNVAAFMQAGAVADLTPYLNSKRYGWSGEDVNDIFPSFFDRNVFPQFGDQVLSVPFTPTVLMMWYNLDLLHQLGFEGPAKTWDAFKAQAAAAVKAGKRGWPVSVAASQIEAMVYSFGGDVIAADGKRALFDSPQALAALTVLEEMATAGTARQVDSTMNATDDLAQFVAGDAPFIFDSSSGRSNLAAVLANDPKDPTKGFRFNWNGTIIPQGSENTRPVTVLNGANATLFRGTPEKQLAGWLLLKYLTTRDATVTWSINTGYLPIRRSALETDAVKRFFAQAPQNQSPFALAPYGRGEPKAAGWTTAQDDIMDAEVAVLNRALSARDAAQRLQQKVNADLAVGV